MLAALGITSASMSCSSLYLHQTSVDSSGQDAMRSRMNAGFVVRSHFAIRDNFARLVIPPRLVTNSWPVSP